MTPKKVYFFIITSFIWLFFGGYRWLLEYKDLSNFIFVVGFFFVGLYVAYDQWHKNMAKTERDDLKKDVQAIDSKCNNLEVKVIELNK